MSGYAKLAFDSTFPTKVPALNEKYCDAQFMCVAIVSRVRAFLRPPALGRGGADAYPQNNVQRTVIAWYLATRTCQVLKAQTLENDTGRWHPANLVEASGA
ncbi:hypothetical protein EMWEY_00045910 [Eimeria maxima]|uniref:Uncharacterized protein n=1 Tax=Eimeria maxima TaxID=5804 RepID=U6MCX5_EIMMA|nr:hypothetical protein EMWEY_00045910 [Eimeria maxima]CDJ61886.1 hypothetical protein EMWEY_00045910 [Eimeria maxima]